ncbi:isoprenylcysteine carboxylmethyltransferase family protein [Mesorhizobium sp.]|uniref:methyltransferase family protein n=1 Tax=Mesorhizobium sp. TaxID=1871066 RepID=UPI000FE5AF44|nr:isoprenylcysteine carboxylmethyltransferase family protein [Mesorhizobium sp.]RWA99469.1 MAG: isoprenylcysteine carboxylmethyltransferase family protein [Mesorhizobium sp.]
MTNQRMLRLADVVGRICLSLYFSYLLIPRVGYIRSVWQHETDEIIRLVMVAAEASTVLFLSLFCAAVITRLPPMRTADRIEPYLTAMAGTFIMGLLVYLPPVQVSFGLRVTALILTTTGLLLSAWVVLWLGRSVSIVPEARRLVTGGPYAIVRHPLYLTEELFMIGAVLMNLSVPAVLIGIIHWGIQLRRMSNEEEILRAAFPDYEHYALRVPKVIPSLSMLRRIAAT